MIIDVTGRKLKALKFLRQHKAVVFGSNDLENWTPMESDELPELVRDPSVMALLIQGEIVSLNEDKGPFFIAELMH
jgi:hypothetical protein